MNHFASIAFAVLLLAQAAVPGGLERQTTAGPLAHEHWQRLLVPAAGHEGVEQCVVLDAELFATAAPGLRDVRLLQGGRELPYAVDESHDDRETGASVPLDDRSIFDTVGEVPLVRSSSVDAASFLLAAHVPVERITLRGSLDHAVDVTVRAMPRPPFAGEPNGPPVPEAEVVHLRAAAGQLSMPVTLGANLQHTAEVEVVVTPSVAGLTSVAFEMRRRELCYKPATVNDEPLRLVYGDPHAELIHYDFALQYKPTATPLLATVGPRETNPSYEAPVMEPALALTLKQKLGVAIGLCVGMLAVTVAVMFRFLR